MRLRPSPLLALLVALVLPAGASAAYAPKLTAKVTPSTAGAPVAVTTTISQAAGETNSKKVVVQFPQEMGVNFDTKASSCTDAQEAARMCPASSLLGHGSATVQGGIALSGTVNLGETRTSDGALKVIVFLNSSSPVVPDQAPIEGFINITPQGPLTTFDGLPNPPLGLTIEQFTLALDGPPNTLVANPATCGSFPLKASFTSQTGQPAASETSFAVTGCTGPPKPNVAPKITHASLVRGGKVRFTLSERSDMTVQLRRGRRLVREIDRSARRGVNTFSRVIPGRLRKGAYTVTLVATDSDLADSKKVTLRFRRR